MADTSKSPVSVLLHVHFHVPSAQPAAGERKPAILALLATGVTPSVAADRADHGLPERDALRHQTDVYGQEHPGQEKSHPHAVRHRL